jgi:hypothetical protein
MPIASLIKFIAGGAIGLPLLASGHGSEFLEAKFFFDRSGTAHLEITADYSGNPMIADQKEARAALDDILRVKIGDTEHKLIDLAPVKLEPRDQPDPTSPMPRAPEFQTMKHELLTALWQWKPTGKAMQFVLPTGRQHSMVFWMKEEQVKEPRWVMLIAGDKTPSIAVPDSLAASYVSFDSGPPWVTALGMLVLALAIFLLWRWCKRHK